MIDAILSGTGGIMLRSIAATVVIFFTVAAGSEAAAQPAQPRAGVLEQLSRCRTVTSDQERLICYDSAAAALDQAEQQGGLVVLDRDQVQETRRQLFGFQITNPFAGRLGGSEEAEIDSIETTLLSAGRVSDNKWLFRLADGSEWRQIDSGEVRFRNREGQAVRIRRASLGSYLMTIENSRAVRVRRQ
jgi:hypothetical protein